MKTHTVTTNVSQSKQRWLRLIAVLGAAIIITFSASGAFAESPKSGGYGTMGGGYTGPGPNLVTVEQVKAMRDDARVALRGHIIQSLGGEYYLFLDPTGTIKVEIELKKWQGQNIGPDDLVEIHGEVDKEWTRVEIEVKRIIKL